jgi:hypothetical protein
MLSKILAAFYTRPREESVLLPPRIELAGLQATSVGDPLARRYPWDGDHRTAPRDREPITSLAICLPTVSEKILPIVVSARFYWWSK